ncbi:MULTISPECIES: pseudaminic acid cytidylyltransferase [unclassified Guyparkeria]|uniref:pseudaminic acid cytidylyltransferase n=1 Tax=unclassified Guyparkeria TaxID=2626246 RepID=UPI0007337988|nr:MULTISPECIES: pseudaminic acid cytidylyltransferase [unclassified Guyparkeria]KTG16105.1 pseudaminic acid cytidylyltransferase [Guyparkeria sp. XI15]OAE84956.1 pseudaminic acid cytidylyltransferase [Guyparkeria sp. WRN-7]
MRVAVIPARGGSKRIPRKNIRPFCGRPMIAWSIEAACTSGCFDRVIVSTDDDEIATAAERLGAEVPFRRPQALADDYAGTVPVVAHAIEWLGEHGAAPDSVCCLYATAPFVRAADLRRGLEALERTGCDYAFSVTSYAFPIQRALRLTEDGRVAMFQPEYATTRSQDLEEAWHDAGQFYWGQSEAWLGNRPVMTSDAVPVVLPRERVQDIDTPEDWRRAEWLFNAMQAEAGESR